MKILQTDNDRVLFPGTSVQWQIIHHEQIEMLGFLKPLLEKGSISIAVIPGIRDSKETQTTRNQRAAYGAPGKLLHDNLGSRIAVVANVVDIKRGNDGVLLLTLEGIHRAVIGVIIDNDAETKIVAQDLCSADNTKQQASILVLRAAANNLLNQLSKLSVPKSVLVQFRKLVSASPGPLCDLLASLLESSIQEKIEVVDALGLEERIAKVVVLVNRQIQILEMSLTLQSKVEDNIGKKRRDFLLRQQLEAIKKELGDTETEGEDEIADLEKKIKEAGLSAEAEKVATNELKRLKRISPSASEHQVIRSYLEWFIEIPWNNLTSESIDLSEARKILDRDQTGLEPVKKRIMEYMAIRKLKSDSKGPIICLLGPPGTGKTSLAKSIASALGRKFYRISLGGVHDESDIRGHRRTYVGAMPGQLVQALHRCGTKNPVILLDEIDKLGKGNRGDPSSALLEALDPEQNMSFMDHYVNVPMDLSKVLFICTANEAGDIPAPLMDRMELHRLSGYTLYEKIDIARNHILPKQIAEHGLAQNHVIIQDSTISTIIQDYTREAGVRNLEQKLAKICRNRAVKYSDNLQLPNQGEYDPLVSKSHVAEILGNVIYHAELSERYNAPGIVTGLAWSPVGGSILFIESNVMPGTGKLNLTGQLGAVIKESAELAVSFIRANAGQLGILFDFSSKDIHIHFPSGSTPKDGPSAGLAIIVSLLSLITDVSVSSSLAMTGEISLRGKVLAVGGIKEKILACHRSGVSRAIVPWNNKRDLDDLPIIVRKDLDIVCVKTVWDAIRTCFPANRAFEGLPVEARL